MPTTAKKPEIVAVSPREDFLDVFRSAARFMPFNLHAFSIAAGPLFKLPMAMTAAEKLKALGRMAAGVGNEISNPLTTISAYAQLLSLHMNDKTSIEYADKIHKGAKRIHHIVNNLTGFANPANESFFPIDLNNVLEETLSFCEYEIKLDEIELVKSIQTPLPKILGSKEQLSQLILALLTNACDALGEGAG